MNSKWNKINKVLISTSSSSKKKDLLIELLNYYEVGKNVQSKIIQLYQEYLEDSFQFQNIIDTNLIVDDDDSNRMIFKIIFKKAQKKYHEANNGLDALQKILNLSRQDKSYYKALWLDIKMPFLNGDCLIDLLRNFFNYPGYIYTITAYSDYISLEKYKSLGTNEIINKPIDIKYILKKLEN